jgi:electron transport complex protein RnfC
MRTFPLVRLRWSNEHIMAALFAVLLLYMLPGWVESPSGLPGFVLLLFLALSIDAAAGFIRYKRPVCSVSAAVTAGVLQLLSPGMPLWGRLAGVAAALLLGKHAWGGTGKNPMNPALTGILLMGFFFNPETLFADASLLYLPAMLLSLPFILFRPFAGVGLISGMALAMLTDVEHHLWTAAVSCIFFGCLIITDPVTVTDRPVTGLIGGFAAGFVPLLATGYSFYAVIGILLLNLASYLLGMRLKGPGKAALRSALKIKSVIDRIGIESELLDLTGGREGKPESASIPEAGEILRRIENHGVFGMGGAGYPTADKLRAVMEADIPEKYLLVNGVECDPGLVHDKWLLKNRADHIERGIELLRKCVGFSRVYVAVKNKNKDVAVSKSNAEIVGIPDMYPSGAERILIEKVLGIRLPQGAVPAAEGILVLNVQTVLAVYEAAACGIDADTRYITVSDLKRNRSRAVRVRLGDRIHETLEKVYPGSNLAFAGGGVMQAHMAEDAEVVDRSTNYIASASMPKYKESPQCSRCGLCRTCCPSGLDAGRIADLIDSDRLIETAALMPDRCLGCGSCSYVCLAGRNLSARMKEAKNSAR